MVSFSDREDRESLLDRRSDRDSLLDPETPLSPTASWNGQSRSKNGILDNSDAANRQLARRGLLEKKKKDDYETFMHRSHCLIHPDESRWLLKWDLFIALLLVLVTILAPFETAFLEPEYDALFIINRVIDAAFLIDLCLQFFTIRKDENNKDVFRHSDIAKLYFRGWFWVDFFSIIPVDLIMMLLGRKTNSALDSLRTVKVVRLMRFLRLVRLLRLSKFQVIISRWHANIGLSYAVLSVLKFLVGILVVSHWMACIWGFLAMQETGEAEQLPEWERSWLSTMMPDRAEEIRRRPLQVYVLSIYWAVMTLTSIGYGDVVPNNMTEYSICTFCMMVMAGLWAYVIGAMCSVVSTMHPHDILFRQNMDAFNEFMDDFNMPEQMRKRLRRYFFESKDVQRQRVEKATINQLSPALQGEVLYYLHHQWLTKIWYFSDLRLGPHAMGGVDRNFIVEAARCLELRLFGPQELAGQERTLFIVRRGICVRMSFEAHAEGRSQLILPRPKPEPHFLQRRRSSMSVASNGAALGQAIRASASDGQTFGLATNGAAETAPKPEQAASKQPDQDVPLGHYERRWPRVYIYGSYWGEDFFLSNELLRDEAPALALTYLEVITFEVSGLVNLLPDFPEVKVSFLQARIHLSLTRAFKKISRVVKFLRSHPERVEPDIGQLISNVLADRCTTEDVVRQADMTQSTAMGRMGSIYQRKKAAIVRNAGINTSVKAQPVVARLENLQTRVDQLSGKQERFEGQLDEVIGTLRELSGKIDKIGTGSVPVVETKRTSSKGVSWNGLRK